MMDEEEQPYNNPNSHEIDLAQSDPVELAIDELLDGDLRADEWRELRLALMGRLQEAIEQRDALPDDAPGRIDWDERIEELREQVAALATEEAVTEFVEDAARATFARPKVDDDYDEFEIDF